MYIGMKKNFQICLGFEQLAKPTETNFLIKSMKVIIDQCANTIRVAAKRKTPLRIRGGGSKDFYGNNISENSNGILGVNAYTGIVDYDPTELVMTARTGTSLADLEAE